MAPLPALSAPLKRLLPIIVSVGMGLLAVGLLRDWVRRERVKFDKEREKLYADYKNPMEVIVAARDLGEGVALETSLLTLTRIPEKFVQPYAVPVSQAGQIMGLVTIAPVAQGEQILRNKVRRREDMPVTATLSTITPKGKRAITIGVNSLTGVGGFVRPGDTIDILWTLKLPGEGQIVTVTLFQNVQVLAVGSEMVGRASSSMAPGNDYTVTLAMTPQEASFLLFARDQGGTLQLSLRPKEEGEVRTAVAPANINSLIQTQLGLPTGPPPIVIKRVELIRGLQREVVALPGQEIGGAPGPEPPSQAAPTPQESSQEQKVE